jgi:hypothetical protein
MLVLFLTRLLAIGLDRAGLPTLQPLLLLQLLLLVAFLALCVAAGPWSNSDATAAIVAGMFGVAAMVVQNAARTDLVPEHPIDKSRYNCFCDGVRVEKPFLMQVERRALFERAQDLMWAGNASWHPWKEGG